MFDWQFKLWNHNLMKGFSQIAIILGVLMLVVVGAGVYLVTAKYAVQNGYQTQDLHPDSSPIGLANPASINCTEQGGQLVMKTRGDGGQYGLCQFEDNQACEEWALYRGDCPKGGLKTTGYDNESQMYCAWLGGKTLAEPNAQCTLPSGKVCDGQALFNGQCF